MINRHNKTDWVKVTIYVATILFLAYLTFICFIVKPNQIEFGNVSIKTDLIDFGGFGSLLAGIFSPLAFLWLILNFRQQNENLKISENNLDLAKKSYQSQKTYQESEYNIQITNTYIESLKNSIRNFQKNGIPYQLDSTFVDEVYREYKRLFRVNTKSTQADSMYFALQEFDINLEKELIILRAIETQILEEPDSLKRTNLLRLLEINIGLDLLIIIRFSAIGLDFKELGYKDYIHYLYGNNILNLSRKFSEVNTKIDN